MFNVLSKIVLLAVYGLALASYATPLPLSVDAIGWLRIVASVLDLPIRRTVTDEGSAYGAALLCGVAAGVFRDVHEAVAASVRLLDTVEPDPRWTAVYEHGYRRFRRLYPALRPLEDA